MTSSPVDVSKLEAALEKVPSSWRVADWLNTQAFPEPWTADEMVPEDRGPFATLSADSADTITAAVEALNAAPAFVALVRAVEALHVEGPYKYCRECCRAWPCATTRAVRAAVGAALNPQETER